MLDVNLIKKDFPILKRQINGKRLVYLDNAATSQKPLAMIKSLEDFYRIHNANVHRGIHTLSDEASNLYEQARVKVQNFIGATHPEEVIFTFNTTDSVNLIAFGWAVNFLKENDEILVSDVEHHSNLVPWQQVADRKRAKLVFINQAANPDQSQTSMLREKLSDRVKIVILNHASNVTGQISPIKELSKLAKSFGAIVVVDGAQAVPHMKVNVQSLGCDFYVFSAHKMLGPTGVGVLWGRRELLEQTSPYRFGGGMISAVYQETAEWAELPEKLEAGTPNFADVVAFGSAIDYLNLIGMENIREHELNLNNYAFSKLLKIDGLHIIGSQKPEERTGLVSFHIDNIHAHDVAAVLNSEGVAVRSGHHCAMPLHTSLKISASTRASYYLYNTTKDLDALVLGIKKAIKILR